MATSNNPGHVIVWEFEADILGLFTPYSDKVSNYIEQEHVKDPTSNKINLGKADPLLKGFELDFPAKLQCGIQSKYLYNGHVQK